MCSFPLPQRRSYLPFTGSTLTINEACSSVFSNRLLFFYAIHDRTLSCLALRLRSLAAEICRTLFPLLSSCFCVEASTLLLAYPNASHCLHLYRSIIYANHITQSIGTVQVKHWYMVSNIIYCCYSLTYRYISFIRFLQPIEPLSITFSYQVCVSLSNFSSLWSSCSRAASCCFSNSESSKSLSNLIVSRPELRDRAT